LLKESIIFFIFKVLNFFSVYVFTWYLSTHLGLGYLGHFTIFYSFIFAIAALSRIGLDILTIKVSAELFSDNRILRLRQFLFISSILIIITALIIGTLSFIPLKFLKLENLFFYILPAAILYSLYGFYLNSLRGLGKIFWFSLLQDGFLYICTLFFYFFGKIPINLGFLLSLIVGVFVQLFLLRGYFILFFNFKIFFFFIKRFKQLSLSLYISQLTTVLLNWVDIFLIQFFLGSKEVGIYQILLRLVTLISFILTIINSILAHRLAIFYKQEEFNLLISLLRKANMITTINGIIFLLIYLTFGKEILNIFNIDDFYAYIALIIMSIGQFFNAWTGSVGLFLNMTNFQVYHRNVLIISGLINFILNTILIPTLGLIGASIAFSITMIIWNISFALKSKQVLKRWVSFFPLLK
jgi:O-antigen/teichoic acid export membrane protein